MECVAILGANSLLGQHLVNAICSKTTDKFFNVNCWDPVKTFINRIEEANNNDAVQNRVQSFVGIDSLDMCLMGCNVVFNLYEVQDFSVCPDVELMEKINVNFVKELIEKCVAFNISSIVHLSSVYLQCSVYWPNIYGRESFNYEMFCKELPFPSYCHSKYCSEKILEEASKTKKIQKCLIARCGALYGEGDQCSLICDAIRLNKMLNSVPLIGDSDGVLQFTYAGNAAHAILNCIEKIYNDSLLTHEMVLILDNTPIKNFYEMILKPLEEENSSKFFKISKKRINFCIFFSIYCFLTTIGWILFNCFGIKTQLAKLPSNSYIYMAFRQWTFFNDFKLQIFFKNKPKFDYETCRQRSNAYYRQFQLLDIPKFSWLP